MGLTRAGKVGIAGKQLSRPALGCPGGERTTVCHIFSRYPGRRLPVTNSSFH